ncbi:MAG TPA: hypothetical protein V6C58_10915 [Allocoleopsis sp.]
MTITLNNEKYISDKEGNIISVILDIQEYEKIRAELEELAEIRAYDQAKSMDDEEIDFEKAIYEIEANRP